MEKDNEYEDVSSSSELDLNKKLKGDKKMHFFQK